MKKTFQITWEVTSVFWARDRSCCCCCCSLLENKKITLLTCLRPATGVRKLPPMNCILWKRRRPVSEEKQSCCLRPHLFFFFHLCLELIGRDLSLTHSSCWSTLCPVLMMGRGVGAKRLEEPHLNFAGLPWDGHFIFLNWKTKDSALSTL